MSGTHARALPSMLVGVSSPGACVCRECATYQVVSRLEPGTVANCVRCGVALRRPFLNPLNFGLLMAVAMVTLLVAGLIGDLAIVEAAGQRRTANLFAGPIDLVRDGLWELSVPVAFASIVAPVAVALLRLYVLTGLQFSSPPPGLREAYRLHNLIRPWAMIDVFIIGYFVAYSKLGALVHIEPDTGFFALFAFMIALVVSDALIDPQSIWEAIDRRTRARHPTAAAVVPGPDAVACESCGLAYDGPGSGSRCPCCNATLHRRKRDSLFATVALAAAALVLYIPANFFPALTVVRFGRGSPSTILGGVWELAEAGELPLAAIVFLASVAVPVFKLMALAAMVAVAVRGRTGRLREFTVLYRVVRAIGRWSMIDIFMESILGSLVRFGAISTIQPGGGAIAFAAVVVLTMVAAEAFDPRLMWDRARQ